MATKNETITYYRGDTETFLFSLDSVAPLSVTVAKLSVRDRVDGDLLLYIDSAANPERWDIQSGSVTIDKGDLDGVRQGWYRYDIELTLADGSVKTVQAGPFCLVGDITNDAATDTPPEFEHHVTASQRAALDAANAPSESNPVATLADVGATAPVRSVQGKTGDVTLTPSDIGALPLTGGNLSGSLTVAEELRAASVLSIDVASPPQQKPDRAQLFVENNGSGGYRLSIMFPDGTVKTIVDSQI